jgi:hypothetical protein
MNKLLYIIILAITFTHATVVNAADSTSNIYYKDQPPASAISPSVSIGSGNDVCIISISAALGTGLFNSSFGTHLEDKACTRRKNAKLLASLGLRVSATALMCQDLNVFKSMIAAGSPCPINGKIGDEAIKEYRKRGILDENNNLVVNHNVVHGNINQPRRNDYGQPTQ